MEMKINKVNSNGMAERKIKSDNQNVWENKKTTTHTRRINQADQDLNI